MTRRKPRVLRCISCGEHLELPIQDWELCQKCIEECEERKKTATPEPVREINPLSMEKPHLSFPTSQTSAPHLVPGLPVGRSFLPPLPAQARSGGQDQGAEGEDPVRMGPSMRLEKVRVAPPGCHLHLRNGVIEYCDDCHHELKGKKVPLPPL